MELVVDSQGRVYRNQQTVSFCHFIDLNVSSRIGNSARYISLPDKSRFETRDNNTVDQLCSRWQAKPEMLIHKMERNLKLVFGSTIILIFVGYIAIVFGIPLISQQITNWLPTTIDRQLEQHTLPQLDSLVFRPSTLGENRQKELTALFLELTPEKKQGYQLLFRDGGEIGANAFALPGGAIIITDQLITLADGDDMIISIIFHEIGHVKHRHLVQNIVRQAGLSALIIAVTGDVNMASSLVLMLPNILIQAQYSQEFEWQADTYALSQLQERNINTNSFADILERMSSIKDKKINSNDGVSISNYFSSHPASIKRIERFRNAAL